jgi:nitrate/nitrite transporter NarK
LALEQRQRQAVRDYSVMEALLNPRVLGLSLVYFGAVATNYGLSFFLPQIVKTFGLNIFLTTVVSAMPYAVGVVGMVSWGRRSDRAVERRFHTAFPLFIAAAGIAVINSIGNLAGFAGPFAMGWIKDHTGSYTGGLLLLAALGILAMGIVLLLGHTETSEQSRTPAAAE